MNDSTDAVHLNNHHRDTLMAIFQHPTSHNIDWRAVVSLLNVTGDAEEMPDGKYRVTLGGEVIIMNKPRHKDIDVQTVVDLRRLLTKAGYADAVTQATDEGKEV
jgi:hypothetical protein